MSTNFSNFLEVEASSQHQFDLQLRNGEEHQSENQIQSLSEGIDHRNLFGETDATTSTTDGSFGYPTDVGPSGEGSNDEVKDEESNVPENDDEESNHPESCDEEDYEESNDPESCDEKNYEGSNEYGLSRRGGNADTTDEGNLDGSNNYSFFGYEATDEEDDEGSNVHEISRYASTEADEENNADLEGFNSDTESQSEYDTDEDATYTCCSIDQVVPSSKKFPSKLVKGTNGILYRGGHRKRTNYSSLPQNYFSPGDGCVPEEISFPCIPHEPNETMFEDDRINNYISVDEFEQFVAEYVHTLEISRDSDVSVDYLEAAIEDLGNLVLFLEEEDF